MKFGNLLEIIRISNYPETYNISSPPGEHDSFQSFLFSIFSLYPVLGLGGCSPITSQQTGTNRHCTRFLVVADVLSLFSLSYQLLNSFSTERLILQNIARHALLPCCRSSAGLTCFDSSFTRAPRDGDTNSGWYLELRQQKCRHWLCEFS